MRFRYYIIYRDNRRDEPRGLFIVDANGGAFPFYRTSYSHVERRWVFNPGIVDYLHGDKDDEAEEVDRSRAEEVAQERGIPFPSDEELERIILDATTGS